MDRGARVPIEHSSLVVDAEPAHNVNPLPKIIAAKRSLAGRELPDRPQPRNSCCPPPSAIWLTSTRPRHREVRTGRSDAFHSRRAGCSAATIARARREPPSRCQRHESGLKDSVTSTSDMPHPSSATMIQAGTRGCGTGPGFASGSTASPITRSARQPHDVRCTNSFESFLVVQGPVRMCVADFGRGFR